MVPKLAAPRAYYGMREVSTVVISNLRIHAVSRRQFPITIFYARDGAFADLARFIKRTLSGYEASILA